MKIKPSILYLLVFVISIIAIIYVSNMENTEEVIPIENSKMPSDEIHTNLNNSQQPTSGNVTSEFKNRMKNLEDYVIANPKDTAKVREYADLLGAAHNPTKAIDLYNSILIIDPKRTDILMNLSILTFNANNIAEAENYTIRILEIDPNNLEAIYNLGVIESRKGNLDLAKLKWQGIVDKYPNSETAKMARESLQKLNN